VQFLLSCFAALLLNCIVVCTCFSELHDDDDGNNDGAYVYFSEGWLSHAVLDVFEREPLPVNSELWIHPHVTLTPHVAGYDTNCCKVTILNRSVLYDDVLIYVKKTVQFIYSVRVTSWL